MHGSLLQRDPGASERARRQERPSSSAPKDSHDAYMKELLFYTQIAENYYDNYLLSKMRKT